MKLVRAAASIVAVCALALGASSVARAEPPGLERWQEHHREAARELGEWVRTHPEAAERFFDWDGHHTERSREFVWWAIEHPGEPIEAFTRTHRGWPEFDFIMERHRPASEAFLGWARRHPEAARELMNHPGGLEWAGHHLYKDYWHMR